MLYIYNLLLYLITPFVLLRLFWRSRKNAAYRKRIRERFGFYNIAPLPSSIWVHTVSLGEAIAAIPLIKALQKTYPKIKIVATTMTPTGDEKLQKIFADTITQFYVPYDYPSVVKRFLRQVNPRLLIIMETELWPNILHYTAKRNIPILLANARLSQHSFSGYRHIKFFIKPMLNKITMVAAQSAADGERFLKLGLNPQKLVISGNIKFDIEVPADLKIRAKKLATSWCLNLNRPVWIAASTHQGEDEKILIAAKKIKMHLPNALLILVPRHPERFDLVAKLCHQQGFKIARFTEIPTSTDNIEIIIGDTIGQLLLFYSLSKVAFVGGSLVPIGGHNLLEPAALGIPILTGPCLDNFREISTLLFNNHAALVVHDANELAEKVLSLLQDDALRNKMAKAAMEIITQNKGALAELIKICHNLNLMVSGS